MKLSENLIKQLIQKSLLLEAKYQFRNLLIFKETIIGEKNLFDEINNTFIQNGGSQHDLNNPKSAGRFFIDVLFECMEEINEIIDAGQQNQIDIPDRVITICNYILFLFDQKEVTSRNVRSGQTFKDYILNFMTNYNKESYQGATTVYEKLTYVFIRINEYHSVSSINSIQKERNYIKSEKETFYPFGKDKIVDGYKVVMPLTTRSSIFWARTNWLGEDIVLPSQDDISWCTARLKGGNMFNIYFVGDGTNLFYFLPEGDVGGTEKFCIGISKRKEISENAKLSKDANRKKDTLSRDDYNVWEYEQWKKRPEDWKFKLYVGGHTTVGFDNEPIFDSSDKENTDVSKQQTRNKLKKALNISDDNILNQLEKVMFDKEPVDNEKYISLLDVEKFSALTNINSLAPIDPSTGKRSPEHMHDILEKIMSVLDTYKSKIYKVKGYIPDEKIIKYIDKNYMYWKKEGIKLGFYIPISLRDNRDAIIEIIKSYIVSGKKNVSEKEIDYDDLLRQIPSSLQNDPVIFKLCLFENIIKRQDPRKIYHDFKFDTLSNDVEKLIQMFKETVEFVKKEIKGFVDKKTKDDIFRGFYLFFSFFIKVAPYEYYLNNPDALLKIADFSNKNNLPSPLNERGSNYIDTKKAVYGKDYIVPIELLSDKNFMLKLIQIDKKCFFLLRNFNSKLLQDEDINLNFVSLTKNNEDIQFAIKNLFDKKNQNKEIITYDFLKNLCDKNILSFYPILELTKNISQEGVEKDLVQIENFLKFIADFISNPKNVHESIFSYEPYSGSLSPEKGIEKLVSNLIKIIKNNETYNSLKVLVKNIISDISLFQKVINFIKKKYKNKVTSYPYEVSTEKLPSIADVSIRKEVEEYIKSNVIIERKENKKLILTESQLRKLINHLL
jgi:hypothetical protein